MVLDTGIYAWIVGLLVAISAALGVYIKGRKDGQAKSDADELRGTIKVQERTNEVLQKSKDISDSVSSASGDDVQQRLRDKYSRD